MCGPHYRIIRAKKHEAARALLTLPEDIGGVLGLDVLERAGAIVNLREGWLTVFAEEPAPA